MRIGFVLLLTRLGMIKALVPGALFGRVIALDEILALGKTAG
jgi:hypothetical protein